MRIIPNNYLDVVEEAGNPRERDMFGMAKPVPDKLEAITTAIQGMEAEYAEGKGKAGDKGVRPGEDKTLPPAIAPVPGAPEGPGPGGEGGPAAPLGTKFRVPKRWKGNTLQWAAPKKAIPPKTGAARMRNWETFEGTIKTGEIDDSLPLTEKARTYWEQSKNELGYVNMRGLKEEDVRSIISAVRRGEATATVNRMGQLAFYKLTLGRAKFRAPEDYGLGGAESPTPSLSPPVPLPCGRTCELAHLNAALRP